MCTPAPWSRQGPGDYYKLPASRNPRKRAYFIQLLEKRAHTNGLPSRCSNPIPVTGKLRMSNTTTMSKRIFETMDGVRVGGVTRLIALSLPISTFAVMFSIGSMFGHPMPTNGVAAFLTLTVAYLAATAFTVTAWNENGPLREGDRLVLIAAATVSVALGLLAASYFWVM